MQKSLNLEPKKIKNNIQQLQQFIAQNHLDGFYVSSFDTYLNEYTPLVECHRYYVTGFTGSVAEVFVPKDGKVKLYVDGRYHQQADLEVDHSEVEVVKCSSEMGPFEHLLKDMTDLKPKSIGHEADRTSLNAQKKFQKLTQVQSYLTDDLSSILEYEFHITDKPIYSVKRDKRGRDTNQKIKEVVAHEDHGFFISALDSIAWLSNARGFHLPFQSTFKAKALVSINKLYLFVEPEVKIEHDLEKMDDLQFIKVDAKKFLQELRHLQNKLHLNMVYFDPSSVNAADYQALELVFGKNNLQEKIGGITLLHSKKEQIEIQEMESSFDRADRAIYNTINWVKDEIKAQKRVTELDLFNQTTHFYTKEGALEQSFKTIAGCGPNGSIIHYSNPSDEIVFKNTDLILLDSGGYFHSGFATDTTRTFICDEKSNFDPKFKEIYTLTLKGLLQAMNAVIPEGSKGVAIDALARQPLLRAGYNYNHGTGHGVGINVHEDGIRFSTVSNYGIYPGQVASIEPGIYIPGFAGVRLENIVKVTKHPKFDKMVCFESLVYIGFEPSLIDQNLLNNEEKMMLQKYEDECAKRKRSFLKK